MSHVRLKVVLTLGIVLTASNATVAHGPGGGVAVATTPHFVFHSDFAINVNDALMEAGRARNAGKPELFQSGAEASCFGELPQSAQLAWGHAVDYYAKLISPGTFIDGKQYPIRVGLAGVEELRNRGDRPFVDIVRNFIGAATPAYETCRWTGQDAENRRWIQSLVDQLRIHEEAVSARLKDYYKKPLAGLPIRVDIVETVSWSGANTILLNPAGGHILISSEVDHGPESLEIVFHEASHTLMGREHPVRKALAEAAEQLDVPLPRDLWHAVLFYTTGDAVRRTLAHAGKPAYTPMLFSKKIFKRFHEPVQNAWPPYLNGERTLTEAAADLIRALGSDD